MSVHTRSDSFDRCLVRKDAAVKRCAIRRAPCRSAGCRERHYPSSRLQNALCQLSVSRRGGGGEGREGGRRSWSTLYLPCLEQGCDFLAVNCDRIVPAALYGGRSLGFSVRCARARPTSRVRVRLSPGRISRPRRSSSAAALASVSAPRPRRDSFLQFLLLRMPLRKSAWE